MKAAAAAASTLLLLTWLLVRGIDVDQRPFDRAFAALGDIELAESAMQRDLLGRCCVMQAEGVRSPSAL